MGNKIKSEKKEKTPPPPRWAKWPSWPQPPEWAGPPPTYLTPLPRNPNPPLPPLAPPTPLDLTHLSLPPPRGSRRWQPPPPTPCTRAVAGNTPPMPTARPRRPWIPSPSLGTPLAGSIAAGLLELLLDPIPSPVVATTTSPACLLLLLPSGYIAPSPSSSSIIATPGSGASPSSFLAQLQGPVSTFSPFPLCSVAVSPWLRARRVRARPC